MKGDKIIIKKKYNQAEIDRIVNEELETNLNYAHTNQMLKYLEEQGTININDVRNNIKMLGKQKILEQHPYNIWKASDERWKTHVNDSTKKGGRRLIAKATRDEIEEEIFKDYVANHTTVNSIEVIFREWMEFALEEKDLTKGTIDRYTNDFNRYIKGTDFANKNIKIITDNDVIKFLKNIIKTDNEEDKIKRKAFCNIKTVINGIFSYAKSEKELECISVSYALRDFKISDKKFKPMLVKDREQVYNDEEATLLINYLLNKYRDTRDLGILFALLTGVRVGELCTLKTIDSEDNILYIRRTEIHYKDDKLGKEVYEVREFPKTQESLGEVILSESAILVLSLIRKINLQNGINSEYIFYEKNLGRLKEYIFNKRLKKICNEVNIPYRSMHKLRKTYASYLLENGMEEKIVQKQMRHKDVSTTHKCYEFSMRKKQYKIDKLNEVDMVKICNQM